MLRRAPGRQQAVVGDEMLLLDTVDERLNVLSASAGLIYQAVDGATTVGQIIATLSTEFGVGEEQLEGDIQGALATLVDEGLIVIDGCEPGAPIEPPRSRSALATERTVRWDRARLQRLDESGPWPIEVGPFLAGAATVMVRMDDPDVAALLTEVLDLLPPAPAGAVVDEHLSVVREGSGAGRWRVYVGGNELVKATTADAAAEAVLAGCNRAAALYPTGAVRFHGGVVERDGRAVVVCGVSGAGKSTLTTAFVRDGWRYLSDEVAIVDPQTLTVTPYPKWIDLGPESLERAGLNRAQCVGPSTGKHHVPPTLLGTVGGSARVVLFVMLAAPDQHHPLQPRPLAGVEAVTMALGNVFATSWDTPGGLQSLADLCSQTSVVTMGRAPLDEMVSQVTDLWAAVL